MCNSAPLHTIKAFVHWCISVLVGHAHATCCSLPLVLKLMKSTVAQETQNQPTNCDQHNIDCPHNAQLGSPRPLEHCLENF